MVANSHGDELGQHRRVHLQQAFLRFGAVGDRDLQFDPD